MYAFQVILDQLVIQLKAALVRLSYRLGRTGSSRRTLLHLFYTKTGVKLRFAVQVLRSERLQGSITTSGGATLALVNTLRVL